MIVLTTDESYEWLLSILGDRPSEKSTCDRPIQHRKTGRSLSLAMVAITFANAPRLAGRSPIGRNTCDRLCPNTRSIIQLGLAIAKIHRKLVSIISL
jgi:hypothetical protein